MYACGKRSMAISDHIAASVRIQDNSNLKSTVLSIIWMAIWHVIIVVSCRSNSNTIKICIELSNTIKILFKNFMPNGYQPTAL